MDKAGEKREGGYHTQGKDKTERNDGRRRRQQKRRRSKAKMGTNSSPTYLSRESPQAMTDTLGGSPIGRNISGRNTPEFPTSTHFFSPA